MRYPKEIEYVKSYLNKNFKQFSPVSNYHSYTTNGIYGFEIMVHLEYDIVDCSEYYNLMYTFTDNASVKNHYTTINTKYNFAELEEMLNTFKKINELWECVKNAESPLLQEKEFNRMLKIINIDKDFV